MQRPIFDSIKDYAEFSKYYWYRDELIKICKAHGLKADGSKIELNKVVEAYFSGEKILPEKKKSTKTHKATVTELALNTGLIECGFTFGNRFREFFKQQTGEENFKFNVDMVATAKVVKESGDESFTLGDLLDIYYGKMTYATDLLYPSFPAQPIPIALHIIGRLTAPIMWFFIAEGYHYTHNIKKYLLRLGIFAVISHFAYCFAFGINFIPFKTGVFSQTSVMYPLFIAVLVLWLQDMDVRYKILRNILVFVLIWSAFPADWSCIAVLAIVDIYRNRGDLKKQTFRMMLWVIMYAVISFFFVSKIYGIVTLFVILVYPVMKQYNGQRGKAGWLKWFFYIYYPAHLIVIGIVRMVMYGNVSILF